MKTRSTPVRRRLLLAALVSVGAAGAAAGSAVAQERTTLVRGGGSTFAAPIFKAWIEAFRSRAPAVDIDYDVIGSGEGISRFQTGSLDFAATDAPLTTAQEAQVEGGVLHVPVTAGMIAVAYHLPGGMTGELRLPRDVCGDIFAGKITTWNDPRIAAANPHLGALPKRTIQVVGRLDRSGTTYAFTNHLKASSAAWRQSGIGAATRVDWPGGAILGRGNEGVAVNILRGQGTIGYVEYGFASRLGLPMATLENAAGAYVAPTPVHGEAAIASAELPANLKIQAPDPAGADSYPIVTFTWSLLRKAGGDARQAQAAHAFTAWTVADGQAYAPTLGYVPLPDTVRKQAQLALAQLVSSNASPDATTISVRP